MDELSRPELDFRVLAESLSAAIWIFDGPRILYANAAAEHLTGYGRAELESIEFWNIVHPDHRALVRDRETARRRGEIGPERYECKFVTRSGAERWLDLSTGGIELHGRQAVLASGLDITDRKQTDESLRRSEAHNRALLDSLPDLTLLLRADGVFLACHAPKDLPPYAPPAEFLGRHISEVLPPPLAERCLAAMLRAAATGETETLEYQLTVNGRPGDFEARIVACGTDELLVFVRDVAERKRAERSLRHNEAMLRAIFDHSTDAIGVSRRGQHVFVNSAYLEMFGYADSSELLGVPILNLIAPDQRATVLDYQQRRLTGRPAPLVYETRGLRKDGVEFDLDVHVATYDFDGDIHSVTILRDITAQKQLELQFRQAQKMEAIGRLAGGIAHDFNNLLTVISGYGRMALNQLRPDEPLFAECQQIVRAADRAAALTGRLLSYSRSEAAQPRILDLNGLVSGMERMIRGLIDDDVRLETHLAPGVLPVRADPHQLEQVLLNLVVNARDAMPGGGVLTLATGPLCREGVEGELLPPADYVMVAVSDTGRGIDKATQSHLFEPFFTTKEAGKGTGLGLWTVYSIVKQSGGEIRVSSEPGKGASFRIYLPAVNGDADRPPADETHRAEAAICSGGTILLVEDEASVRQLVRAILHKQGYQVIEASDPLVALEIAGAASGPIDLLLTDVIMPGMNGRALAEKLLSRRPGLKVIFISGYSSEVLGDIAEIAGGFAFLHKPFTPAMLLDTVRDALADRTPPDPA